MTIRTLLARVCSADTMRRIVDPVLADIAFESDLPRWRGWLALGRALLVHGVTSLPAACARLYHDDERAVPRMLALSCVTALIGALPFVFISFRNDIRSFQVVALLMPQALALTIPAAILVAFPLALRRVTLTGRVRRRAIALLVVLAALTGVVMDRVVPRANQAFRERIAGHSLPPGTNETAIRALRRDISALKAIPGGNDLVRRTEYALHLRMALMCAPLPLGLFALALSATRSGRQRPWRLGGSGLLLYFLTLYPLEFLAQDLLRTTALPAPVLAWMPMSAIAVLAAAGYRQALRRAPAA